MFSIVTALPYIPTNSVQRFPFLHILASPCIISCLFDNNNSHRCKVLSHCGFHLHFSDDRDVEHLFMCLSAICMSSSEKKSIQILCSLFFLLTSEFYFSFNYIIFKIYLFLS